MLVPRNAGRKPAVLVVETGDAPSPLARQLAAKGNVVLAMNPRGIPDGNITSQGFGEGQPRVPTADGVRELQNRRVEITYGPGSGM